MRLTAFFSLEKRIVMIFWTINFPSCWKNLETLFNNLFYIFVFCTLFPEKLITEDTILFNIKYISETFLTFSWNLIYIILFFLYSLSGIFVSQTAIFLERKNRFQEDDDTFHSLFYLFTCFISTWMKIKLIFEKEPVFFIQ